MYTSNKLLVIMENLLYKREILRVNHVINGNEVCTYNITFVNNGKLHELSSMINQQGINFINDRFYYKYSPQKWIMLPNLF